MIQYYCLIGTSDTNATADRVAFASHQIPDVEQDVASEDAGERLRDPLPEVDLDVGKVLEVPPLPVTLRLLVQLVPDLDGLGRQLNRYFGLFVCL